jgi:Icc-related predicted phosphoesterase
MLNRRTFIATVALSSLSLPRLAREVSAFTGEPVDPKEPQEQKPTTILICAIGDLQRTSPAEKMVLSRTDNFVEREKIIKQVAAEKPDLLLLLGDQVSDAADAAEWEYFDGVTKPLRDANITTIAVRGNHDYNLSDKRMCDRECNSRWPETRNRPHFYTLGPLAFIGIDSNLDMLTMQEARGQQGRFVEALEKFDKDPNIRGIIVFSHHPPYTNSFLGPNQEMITQYAEPFLKSKKTKLFLCGHVHSYERFTYNKGEKFFVTSGGGGGPRRTIDVSSSRPFQNDFNKLGELRPFNFLKLTVDEKEIRGEAMMVQKKGFVVGDKFRVKLYDEQVVATPQ